MLKKIIGIVALAAFMAPFVASASTDTVSITLAGSNPQSVAYGSVYVDPGYTANSTVDGNITGSVTATNVNTTTLGSQDRVYDVTDSLGNTADAVREVIVGGSGAQPNCSGPTAPGWNVSLPGGGCNFVKIPPGYGTMYGGVFAQCPAFFTQDCVIKE